MRAPRPPSSASSACCSASSGTPGGVRALHARPGRWTTTPRRGTELGETLEAYFGAGGSLSRTAGELHVHVNTVTQRLDRIARLLGEEWQEPERQLEVQLALRLHRLSD